MIIQYGVLAYAQDDAGQPHFLLITSRETRRWIIPRGNVIPGLSPYQIAAQEAYEEAGVLGAVRADELGSYRYEKKRRARASVPALVHVFALAALRLEPKWPEAHQRERRWFTAAEAAEAVEEPGLKRLILAFSP